MLNKHFNDVFIYNVGELCTVDTIDYIMFHCYCSGLLVTKMVTEVKPYGISPSPRRRVGCGYCNAEFIICGGTRLVGSCDLVYE